MSKTVKISRETLYGEVWNEPMTSLAIKYGLSDVGLRKICKKMRIPLPPQGYHLRKSKQEKLPLPNNPDVPQEYTANVPEAKPDRIQSEDLISEIAFEKDPANRIRVPRKLVSPHKFVVLISRAMDKQKPDDYGRIHFHAKVSQEFNRGYLNRRPSSVSIFPGSMNRVLWLLDALFKALEKRNFKILQPINIDDIHIEILGELISVQVFERAKRKARKPKPEEKKRKKWFQIH
jgi:hypothetical protein